MLTTVGTTMVILGWQSSASPVATLSLTIGGLLIASGVLTGVSGFDRRSNSVLRLDWFLPPLRRIQRGHTIDSRMGGRLLRAVSPGSWLSNHETKQRGKIRIFLRRLGISFLASPPRRLIQAFSLLLFLVLFFYVCWPYNARPPAAGRVSAGWRFSVIDQASGEVTFERTERDADEWLVYQATIYMRPSNVGVRPFPLTITDLGQHQIRLLSDDELSDEAFDAMLLESQTWDVCESDPQAWPSHYTDNLSVKERIPAETFLIIDPLVSLSTAVASRNWVWSLLSAGVILIVCLLIPRGFCGYLCPLGTTIDLFDWAITSRTRKYQLAADGWWVHIKYYLLAGTLIAAICGVLISGFVSAIPIITRALLFIGDPMQSGVMRGWHLVPPMNFGHFVSITLFFAVLGLGYLRPRFWCKYVCPSGAVFSVGNLFRVTERKVESSCIDCNKCVEICPFDAIKPDFTTRGTDCTMCQSCGGVCPTHAIKFVERWNGVELKVMDNPPTGETALGRRGFLSLAAGSSAAAVGGIGVASGTHWLTAAIASPGAAPVVRPPGSVPEPDFLQQCIRCGECFKACPNNVLQPESFERGIDGLWTPKVEADWAGCESSCNACGQVCPTGAIRALPLEEKRFARMGLAMVNQTTCLPLAGREECDLCVQECNAAGYHAIEYMQVGTEVDEDGIPIEGTGMLAPVVLEKACVGCGLCQTRCYGINVKERGILKQSAIIIEAGEGKEDRIQSGSYRELHRERTASLRSPSQQRSINIAPAKTASPIDDLNNDVPTDKAPRSNDASDPSTLDDNPFGL